MVSRLGHIPPTAFPITTADFISSFIALWDPTKQVERFKSLLKTSSENHAYFLVSSGRAALTLILLALRRSSDRTQVILPAYSCPTVVLAVLKAGLQPIFCDVSPVTLGFERDAMIKLLDRNPLAILPTHLYGLALDIKELLITAQAQRIFIIEDAAQAYGARIDGKMVGTLGDAGFYSLGWGKCLPVGKGGVIVVQEELTSVISKTLEGQLPSNYPKGPADLVALMGYALLTHPLGWWFVKRSPLNPASAGMDVTKIPSYDLKRLSAARAGLGLSLLIRLQNIQQIAQHNAERLIEALSGLQYLTFLEPPPSAEPVYLRLPMLVDNEKRANQLFERLNRSGIGVSRTYWRTLPDLFPELTPDHSNFPGADHLARCLLTLPTHALMLPVHFEQIMHTCSAVDKI